MNDLERVLTNLARLLRGEEEPITGPASASQAGARPGRQAPPPRQAPAPPSARRPHPGR